METSLTFWEMPASVLAFVFISITYLILAIPFLLVLRNRNSTDFQTYGHIQKLRFEATEVGWLS